MNIVFSINKFISLRLIIKYLMSYIIYEIYTQNRQKNLVSNIAWGFISSLNIHTLFVIYTRIIL